MVDDGDGTVFQAPALLTPWAQAAVADLTGQRGVSAAPAEWFEFVGEGADPQVSVFGQTGADVVDEGLEGIGDGLGANPGGPLAGQVGADGLAVSTEVAGDRGDRDALGGECVGWGHLPLAGDDVFLPCQHLLQEFLRVLVRGQRPPASEGLRLVLRSHTGGEFQ
ncbi:hypothetical protein OG218_03550 [Kineococcus sp. NBC_00420]|uniref:hypothetical protein n=1 Tax=Kineococcus sp. NBC_00420 TaxID=2903564 RepID=UPI002E2032C6